MRLGPGWLQGLYRGCYIGIMEQKMATTLQGLGFRWVGGWGALLVSRFCRAEGSVGLRFVGFRVVGSGF